MYGFHMYKCKLQKKMNNLNKLNATIVFSVECCNYFLNETITAIIITVLNATIIFIIFTLYIGMALHSV